MRTVLIIDDDESIHFLSKWVFSQEGEQLKFLTAMDGLQALEILQKGDESPDLILLDINMPRMNGHEFLTNYSKLTHSDIPIVAMLTSSNEQVDRDNAMRYSFVKDYIIKPIRKEHVARLKSIYRIVCNSCDVLPRQTARIHS